MSHVWTRLLEPHFHCSSFLRKLLTTQESLAPHSPTLSSVPSLSPTRNVRSQPDERDVPSLRVDTDPHQVLESPWVSVHVGFPLLFADKDTTGSHFLGTFRGQLPDVDPDRAWPTLLVRPGLFGPKRRHNQVKVRRLVLYWLWTVKCFLSPN